MSGGKGFALSVLVELTLVYDGLHPSLTYFALSGLANFQ